ncbi:DUF3741 domain-containing protein [Tanacetum coccineum]|uniref:DUF3741 domain-containing protein n=1 Tax=Tanacetum coccineum TaxID=301880 RepID=A0ABQ5HCY0_9ASTR
MSAPALVRETFMEAKCLSTDEKLRQSKQFQDALEFLSSNKEVFLKFLQEPNSLFSEHHNLPYVPPPPDSRCITILRPSKLADGHKLTGSVKKNGKQINKNGQMGHCNTRDKSTDGVVQPPKGYLTPPTCIVVLKPSFGNPHQMKVVGFPSSLRTSNDDGFYEDSEAPESIEVPKESTCDMSETPRGHDTTLADSIGIVAPLQA